MDEPIFDNYGRQVATRCGTEVTSMDGSVSYHVDAAGNLLDKTTGRIVGRLTPLAGQAGQKVASKKKAA